MESSGGRSLQPHMRSLTSVCNQAQQVIGCLSFCCCWKCSSAMLPLQPTAAAVLLQLSQSLQRLVS
jgi:hypothetical protein